MLFYPVFPLAIGRVFFIRVVRAAGFAVAVPLAFFPFTGANIIGCHILNPLKQCNRLNVCCAGKHIYGCVFQKGITFFGKKLYIPR